MEKDDFEIFMDKVFRAVREKRTQLGISQGELSKRVGKPQSSIARLEAGGVRDPRISMFYQLGKAMGVNPAELIGAAFDEELQVSDSNHMDWRVKKIVSKIEALKKEQKEQVSQVFEDILKLV